MKRIKIKPKAYTALTQAVFANFAHRKGANTLSIITDTETGKIYPVPRELEHIDLACLLLHTNRKEFQEQRTIYLDKIEKLIPTIIEFSQDCTTVTGIITGVSGMELGYRIRHTENDLNNAHALAKQFIKNGDFEIDLTKDEIIMKFKKAA
ncbi:hypothetical protein DRJ22_00055 [Candidatus Woesearchaeota archaeon]|nr:MAG: hypothetical protein B6U93_01420 [Candidatus Woesearchaeota archaeon ex4484_78]RLE47103.1 MAG: hypothetical protein DRJ22_00055 [Candidatus Woesearchaeota archaeon]